MVLVRVRFCYFDEKNSNAISVNFCAQSLLRGFIYKAAPPTPDGIDAQMFDADFLHASLEAKFRHCATTVLRLK